MFGVRLRTNAVVRRNFYSDPKYYAANPRY